MARRGPWLLAALWAVTAALAMGVGLVAVRLVASQVSETGAAALDATDVGAAVVSLTPTATARPSLTATPRPSGPAGEPSPAPAVSSTRPSSPPSAGPARTVATRGGVVTARCVSSSPRLVAATPAEGYRIEDSRNDRVRFESESRRVEVRLACKGNTLTSSVREDDRSDDGSEASPSPSRDD